MRLSGIISSLYRYDSAKLPSLSLSVIKGEFLSLGIAQIKTVGLVRCLTLLGFRSIRWGLIPKLWKESILMTPFGSIYSTQVVLNFTSVQVCPQECAVLSVASVHI